MHYSFEDAGDTWQLSWHGPASPPEGIQNGSSGVCVTAQGEIVIITEDGEKWDVPGGRPEGDEDWEQTLRREMVEEACVAVTSARLLGFARGECLAGREQGKVIVRSFWRAEVVLLDWKPEFEIVQRRLVSPAEALNTVYMGYRKLYHVILQAAGFPLKGLEAGPQQ
ncbi:MAG: NUDIX hydrolase [Chloroflexaceae bacterium]|jgi:ADP-ribose pyrophosphatase YjhB (NUDIX family)|nr:NUDIX hydrolase [Chloroflexaceae bacterium]